MLCSHLNELKRKTKGSWCWQIEREMTEMMWLYVGLAVLALWSILCTIYAWRLHKKSLVDQRSRPHYYETCEWTNNINGVKYAQNDEDMDSVLFLPSKNSIFWMKGRKVSEVQPNGTFTIKFANGGRLNGCVHAGDKKLELVGLSGTPEEGITETMILNE